MAAEARAWGIQAQAVHGNLPTGTRERRIADFLGGKILLLVTVGLLTEGFDAPDAVVCILARPYTVVSIRVLLPQSIGRVVRATPGKPTPIVIELVDEDSTGRRRGVADYFGSSPEPDRKRVLRNPALAAAREAERTVRQLWDALAAMLYPKYDEDRRRPEAPEIAAYFDVVAYVEASAGIRWLRTGTGTVYLPLGEAVPEGGGAKVHRWAEVVYDLTNLAIGYLHEGTSVQRIALQPSLPAAIEEASAFLHKSGDPGLILADADADWRLEPSTRFQQDWLAELLRPPANQYTVLTRGAASDAIGILEWAERTKKANIDSRAA